MSADLPFYTADQKFQELKSLYASGAISSDDAREKIYEIFKSVYSDDTINGIANRLLGDISNDI